MHFRSSNVHFVPPIAQNSFKKTERNYPKAISYSQDNKFQESKMVQQTKNVPIYVRHMSTSLTSTKSNNLSQRYHFQVQDPFPIFKYGQNPIYDENCIWYKALPNNSTKNTVRGIKFNKITYVITNWSGQLFPSTIYLCLQNCSGYCNQFGQLTDRLMALQMVQLYPVIDQGNVRTYDIKYNLQQQTYWQMPPQLTQLIMTVKYGNQPEPVKLPLKNPLIMSMQITTQ